MSRSGKLGIASVMLTVGAAFALPSSSTQPISFACAVLACVLAVLASLQGSKVWLTIPCSVVSVFGFLFYIGMRAT
jgi:hypothetical protein